jgi:Queuosine salvage protein
MSESVRTSTAAVMKTGGVHVTINQDQLAKELSDNASHYDADRLPPSWAQDYHFWDEKDADKTAQYILVLDALNFCFWPLERYEYNHLASSLKVRCAVLYLTIVPFLL